MVIVLPGAPAGAGGREAGAPGTGGRDGGAAGLAGGGAEGFGAAVGTAFGFARICFTWSMSFCESNGLGMCPFAPTAIALEGSMGVPPPSRRTGMCRMLASARTFSHNS
jgi:hypothetical protein